VRRENAVRPPRAVRSPARAGRGTGEPKRVGADGLAESRGVHYNYHSNPTTVTPSQTLRWRTTRSATPRMSPALLCLPAGRTRGTRHRFPARRGFRRSLRRSRHREIEGLPARPVPDESRTIILTNLIPLPAPRPRALSFLRLAV